MARPVSWKDLPNHSLRGDEIARWSGYNIMSHPSVAKHLIAAAEVAQKAGLIVDSDGIFEKLSPEKMDANLAQAQARWDELESQYKVAIDFQSPNSELYYINQWASENGLPRIKSEPVPSDNI